MPYLLCQHVMISGLACGSPAERGQTHCFYHHSLRRLLPKRFHSWESYRNETDHGVRMIPMPLLEDATSLQTAYMQIIHGVLSGQMDLPRSRVALAALRAAARNLPFLKLERAAVAEAAAQGPMDLPEDVSHSQQTRWSNDDYRRLPDPPQQQQNADYVPPAPAASGDNGQGEAGHEAPTPLPANAAPSGETPAVEYPEPLYIRKRAAEKQAQQAAAQAVAPIVGMNPVAATTAGPASASGKKNRTGHGAPKVNPSSHQPPLQAAASASLPRKKARPAVASTPTIKDGSRA